MKLKINQWLIMNREFGLRNYTQTKPESIKRLTEAYLTLRSQNVDLRNSYSRTLEKKLTFEIEVENLRTQKKILMHSLEFARDDINELEGSNIVLKLKLNGKEAIIFTLCFCLVLNFLGFGFVAWSLTNMVR